jgi:hypothetical protein
MKPEVLEQFRHAQDFSALTRAVLALCEPFGPIHSFRLVHNKRARRVACSIELDSPKRHAALIRALGAYDCGGLVYLDIPVGPDFGGVKNITIAPSSSEMDAPLQRPQPAGIWHASELPS